MPEQIKVKTKVSRFGYRQVIGWRSGKYRLVPIGKLAKGALAINFCGETIKIVQNRKTTVEVLILDGPVENRIGERDSHAACADVIPL